MLQETSVQWKKEKIFSLYYSYNLMTYFMGDNLQEKMQVLLWKNIFLCAVWSRQHGEPIGVLVDRSGAPAS